MSESRGGQVPVHTGDLGASDRPLRYPSGLVVTGSVGPGVRLEAGGDVYVRGDARGSSISSAGGRVAITGAVLDTQLHAASDILCGRLHHADLCAGRDIHLLAEARQSTLQASGNLHVKLSMEYSLQAVQVEIGGGVVLDLQTPAPGAPIAGDRQHQRVSTDLEGMVACHGAPPFQFQPCMIDDLSGGGLRCTLAPGASLGALSMGMLLQVKLGLPGEPGQIVAIARLVRIIESQSYGLSFLTLAEHDRQRLKTYCLQRLLTATQRKLALRHNRTSDLQQESLLQRRAV